MSAQDLSPIEDNAQDVAGAGADTGSAAPAATKVRPRLDLSTGPKERKRGKSMFGLVLGTLNKAKIEDKERNASEAAKKRQLIDQRLQNKLRKETDSVRRAEEAKKDKSSANRKEEDVQLKNSIYKFRRRHLPQLSRFLSTSDDIPVDDSTLPTASADPLSQPQRSHPPPLYYLPAILLPAQEAFLNRRTTEVREAAEKEWTTFTLECKDTVGEIATMRRKVAEEELRSKVHAQLKEDDESKAETKGADEDGDARMGDATQGDAPSKESESKNGDEAAAMQGDDEDAVEY